jgi:hypothetical protein
MNLDSFKSLENELTKNIPAFYKELLKTWITCRVRFIESCVIRVSFHSFGIAFFKIFSSDIQFCLFLNLAIILYSEI